MKILVVDDDVRIRDLFKLWLEREGFQVFLAENGMEGVLAQRQHSVDILICDLIMPVQEGIETIAQFRAEFPATGIVAISGGGMLGPDSYLTVAEQLGAWKAFKKPVDMALLIETLYEWQKSERA